MISIAQEALSQLKRVPGSNPKHEAVLAYARQCGSYSEFNKCARMAEKMRRYGLTPTVKDITRYRASWTPEEVSELVRLRERGLPFKEIAARLGKKTRATQEKLRRINATR